MAKTDIMEIIKKNLKSGNLVFGTKQTTSLLKRGGIEVVYLSENCPADMQAEIEHLAKLAGVSVEKLTVPSDELGTLCKKQYVISVLSVKKA